MEVSFLVPLAVFAALVAWVRSLRRRAFQRALLDHMAVLTARGLPLGPGLLALAKERHDSARFWQRRGARKEGERLRGLAERADATGSVAAALATERGIVDQGALALLRCAEPRGALPQALEILARESADRDGEGFRMIERLWYPAILALQVLGMSSFLRIFMIPKLQVIFESIDVELPVSVDAGETVHAVFAVVVLGAFATGAAYIVGGRVSRGIAWVTVRIAARMPLLGAPLRRLAHARWLARVGAFLDAGATLPEALDGARADAGLGAAGIGHAAGLARAGEPIEMVLAAALSREANELSAPLLLAMAAEGLPAACASTAARLRERATRRLNAIADAARPVPVLVCASVVAFHACLVWGAITKLEGSYFP